MNSRLYPVSREHFLSELNSLGNPVDLIPSDLITRVSAVDREATSPGVAECDCESGDRESRVIPPAFGGRLHCLLSGAGGQVSPEEAVG